MGNNKNNSNNNDYSSNNAQSYYQQQQGDDGIEYLSDIQQKSTVTGLFGIDPLHYTEFCIICLALWALYLLIPKGIRFRYCGSYPKRYAWSSRIKRRRERRLQGGGGHSYASPQSIESSSELPTFRNQNYSNGYADSNTGAGSTISTNGESLSPSMNTNHRELSTQGIGAKNNDVYNPHMGASRFVHHHHEISQSLPEEEVVDFTDFTSPQPPTSIHRTSQQQTPFSSGASTFNDEIAISTTMQQLRDTGVKIIAHGSKGKPKSVRLLLTENAIEWRTESTKKKNKVGKTHQVPLSHIMYVDVGKQTTALRRVENASIAENVCLSLLTRDGSLDLEASSVYERDALVNCFSLVLDEVHAKNWRDVYRAPSSDLPSSFDEFDMGANMGDKMEV